jgi:hypothetical protein
MSGAQVASTQRVRPFADCGGQSQHAASAASDASGLFLELPRGIHSGRLGAILACFAALVTPALDHQGVLLPRQRRIAPLQQLLSLGQGDGAQQDAMSHFHAVVGLVLLHIARQAASGCHVTRWAV